MGKDTKLKPAIEVKNVSKFFKLPHERKSSLKQHFVGMFSKKPKYEEFEALKNIDFTVNKGDFFGIVGRNGSGKSTLLKIISGIYQPSSGSVKINGTLTPFIELGIGFNPELTGRENVYLNGSILGLTKKQIDSLYDEIVDFAELKRFMDQKLKNYSSGMQVRLAFSIAIRAQNDILLLDEVLAVGDINFQKKCFNYFQKLKSEKKTVIFVTHDMNAVKEYCNRAVLINDSKVVPTKDINDVLEKYMEIMNPSSIQSNAISKINKSKKSINLVRKSSLTDIELNILKDTMELNYKIKGIGNEDSEELYSAFSIKDVLDNKLFGASSKLYNRPIKNNSKVSWKMVNILSRGKYNINISISNREGVTYQTFENAYSFKVDSLNNYFPINPVRKIDITSN
jgi:ABC-2 type transport system ATP-binding protein